MSWGYELREGTRVWYLTEEQYTALRYRLEAIFTSAKPLAEEPPIEQTFQASQLDAILRES